MATERTQLTIRINKEVIDRIKDIVYWSPEFTINNFVEASLKDAIEGFSHIDPRPHKRLKPGRKIS
jgi:hypothetical protein